MNSKAMPKLRERMLESNIEALVVYNQSKEMTDKFFFYIVRPESGVFENSWLIITLNDVKIITSKLEEQAAKESGIETMVYNGKDGAFRLLGELLADKRVVGINFKNISAEAYFNIEKSLIKKELVDVSEMCNQIRTIKNEDEISKIAEACDIAEKALYETIDSLAPGVSEKYVASKLSCSMLEHGATLFFTGVSFGENTAVPHHHPTSRALRRGDFILMDFGCMFEGYWSDITRTFSFGKADGRGRKIYETVKMAQQVAFDSIKAGVLGKDVHEKVRMFIDSSGYGGKFIHGLGHGLGMSVHDHPAMGINSQAVLEQGMVVTVEPGIYILDYGGVRIEDDVVVNKEGVEFLSKFSRELIEI